MAQSKPSKVPRWADNGGAIVEPSEPKKDVGWVAPEKPPDTFFNFLLNLTGEWFKWITERFQTPSAGSHANDDTSLQINDPQQGAGEFGTVKTIYDGPSVGIGGATAITGFPGGGDVDVAGATFQASSVTANDVVELAGTPADDGFYLVSAVPLETRVTLRRLDGAVLVLAGGAPGGTCVISANKSQLRIIAPGGIDFRERIGGTGINVKVPTAVVDHDWIFPVDNPASGTRNLTITDTGQVGLGVGAFGRAVQIGDGVSSFGDFNGSDHAPFVSAIADVVANGGFIQVLGGTYTFTAVVSLVTGPKFLFVGSPDAGVRGPGTGALPIIKTDGVIARLFADLTETDTEFRNIRFENDNASTEQLIELGVTGFDSVVTFRNCELIGSTDPWSYQTQGGGAGALPRIIFVECVFDRAAILFGDNGTGDGTGTLIQCKGTNINVDIRGSNVVIDQCDLTNDGASVLDIDDIAAPVESVNCRVTNSLITRTDEGTVINLASSNLANHLNHHYIVGNHIRCLGDVALGPDFSVILWGAAGSQFHGNRVTYEDALAQAERWCIEFVPSGAFAARVNWNSFNGNMFDADTGAGSTGGAVYFNISASGGNTPKECKWNSFIGNQVGRDLFQDGANTRVWRMRVSATGGNEASCRANAIVGNSMNSITLERVVSGGTEFLTENALKSNVLRFGGSFTFINVADDANGDDLVGNFVSSTTPGFLALKITTLAQNQSTN